jgi:hypothetical protein
MKESSKGRRLIILQSAKQFRHYFRYLRDVNDLILPIGPSAMYEVSRKGLEYLALPEIWSTDEFEKEKQEISHAIQKVISELNAYSAKVAGEYEIEIGNYFSFQLAIIITQVIHNNFLIGCIENNLNPTEVYCYSKKKPEVFLDIRPDPDAVFSEVLANSEFGKHEACKYIKIREKSESKSLRQKVLSLVPARLRRMLRGIRSSGVFNNTGGRGHELVVVGAPGDWLRLTKYEEFNKNFTLASMPELRKAPDSEGMVHFEAILSILSRAVSHKGNIIYRLDLLAINIARSLAEFAGNVAEVDEYLRQKTAVVSAVLSFPLEYYLSHRAIKHGLSVIIWQHGEKGQSALDVLDVYTELVYSTHYLAYAPVVAGLYHEWIGKNYLKDVRVVGSIDKHIEWEGGNSILYATGKWLKTTWPGDADWRLFDAHMKILGFLETVGDSQRVILKANNTPRLNEIPYSLNNVEVEFNARFTDCLKTAKLVILDTPATTLIEACTTAVPVFVLGGRTTYRKEFLDEVKKRVVWSETPEDLIIRVKDFLASGDYPANVHDTSFLAKYGPSAPPRITASHVSATLMDIIECSGSTPTGTYRASA